MSSTVVNKQDIFNYLKEVGCCDTCCLRYFNGRGDDYNDLPKSFKTRGIKYSNENDSSIVDKDKNVDANVGDDDDDDQENVQPLKKSKSNICIACLGVFSEEIQLELIDRIIKHSDLEKYQCDTILTSFSLPILFNLRNLSIWIGLIRKFPNQFSLTEPPDVPLKEIIKTLINPIICEKLNKKFEQRQNGMMINIFLEHNDEESELKQLFDVNPDLFRERIKSPRKFNREFMTRNAFDRYFTPNKINIDIFVENVPVPGRIPVEIVKLDRITIQGPTVFLAGRYRKMSRELCQTPWILKGERLMESSVSECIIDQIAPYFGVLNKTVIFSSSGREDVDVRCLGKGRPFYLEIPDAHQTCLSRKLAGEMERAVDSGSLGKVSIRNLQMCQREELTHIKMGEESKKKIYRALCVVKEPVTAEIMNKLTIPDGFLINQWTPLRVLHRRPLLKRPRQIYSIKGFVNKDNHRMIILDLITQAGTYVKELVHGEFGRTSPSISSVIGQWIDIVALDVLAIDLDWPEEIDNQQLSTQLNENTIHT